jgi:WD40 repeat protein
VHFVTRGTLAFAALALVVLSLNWRQTPSPGKRPATSERIDLYGDPLPEGALARLGTVRFRNPEWVSAVAYSPDGKTVAVFSYVLHADRGLRWSDQDGGVICLWDTTTGKLQRRLDTDLKGEPYLGFSGDGKRLAAIGYFGSRFWDTATGKAVRAPEEFGSATCAAYTPDGGAIALSAANSVRLLRWDGKEVRPLESSKIPVGRLAFSPDGKTIAAAFGYTQSEHGVCLWDVATGRVLRKLLGVRTGPSLAVAPDGKTVAAPLIDDPGVIPLHVWDADTGKSIRTLGERNIFWYLAFVRGGKELVAVRRDSVVRWDVATGKELRRFGEGRISSYSQAALAPDGKTLAFSVRNSVRLLDTETGREVFAAPAHVDAVEAVGFSPDGKTALTGADGLSLWDAATGKRLTNIGPPVQVGAAAFSPDGKAVLAGYTRAEELRLWETATGKELRLFAGAPGEVEVAGFLADGRSVVSMSSRAQKNRRVYQPGLQVWDGRTGKPVRQLGNDRIHRAAVSADGRRLAAGMNELHVWDAPSGRELAKFGQPADLPLALAFTPDGRRLAVASSTGRRIRLWEVAVGTEGGSIVGRDVATVALAVSPDGRALATGGSEGTVGLWDLASGKELLKRTGHQGPVLAVAFSADGRRLISGSRDTTALIWDVAGVLPVEPVAPLEAAEVKQLRVALASPDGAAALQAVRRLARAPEQALPFLRDLLRNPPAVDRDRLARLLADLDAGSYAKREAASAELARLGKLAEAGLKRALEKNPSAEVRRRAEALFSRLDDRQVSPATLQAVRALEVLELLATPEARTVIAALAEGGGEARVAEEARAAMARLARR